MLVDHATGLDASYFRPSEKQVLQEFLKAEPYLTISNEARLQIQNAQLNQRDILNSKMLEEFAERFEAMEKRLGMNKKS